MSKTSAHILIIDDDTDILISARLLLKQFFTQISVSNNPKELNVLLSENEFDAILLDMNYQKGLNSGREGLYWLKHIKSIKPDCAVVMMTAFGQVEVAVECLKSGAADYILKPWNVELLPKAILAALQMEKARCLKKETSATSKKTETSAVSTSSLIAGEAMEPLLQMLRRVAPTDANVLILGENGTGKQVIAEEIHHVSLRKNKPFLHVDLGALSGSLFESALFGHAKGSFTDAKEDHAGYFETAEGGTLFLDEIGNLPLSLQAKLLQVLQSRVINRLGESKPRHIDVRIICATNMNLENMVVQGSFRQDLLYRINTVVLQLPPLRERKKDIPLLCHYFLERYNAQYGAAHSIGDKALQAIHNYSWPGNIRELQHVMERAVILSETAEITVGDLNLSPAAVPVGTNGYLPDDLDLVEMEKLLITKALQKHQGNISRAATELGLTRAALYRRIEKFGI